MYTIFTYEMFDMIGNMNLYPMLTVNSISSDALHLYFSNGKCAGD